MNRNGFQKQIYSHFSYLAFTTFTDTINSHSVGSARLEMITYMFSLGTTVYDVPFTSWGEKENTLHYKTFAKINLENSLTQLPIRDGSQATESDLNDQLCREHVQQYTHARAMSSESVHWISTQAELVLKRWLLTDWCFWDFQEVFRNVWSSIIFGWFWKKSIS